MHQHNFISDSVSSHDIQPRSVRQHSSSNRLALEDRPAHDWYRFVLSYPPHLVRDYLEKFGVSAKNRVLDPFCGTGTTLVECKRLGIPSVGVEASPLAHFVSTVKIDWSPNPDEFVSASRSVAEAVLQVFRDQGIMDDPWGTYTQITRATSSLRTLDTDLTKLLLTNSISPLPMHKVLVLLEHLKQYASTPYYRHQLVALAKALVFSISNLSFGPEVGIGTIKHDTAVLPTWLANITHMAHDLSLLAPLHATPAHLYHADARQMLQIIEPHSIDVVITSPPYPNEKDYTRTTRLESVLLGFISNKTELQSFKKRLVRSNTRGVYKEDDDDRWVAQYPEIQQLAETIEERRIALGKTSGFERLYGRVTKLYFGGMAQHLATLQGVLRPGAHLAYVVGDQASYLRVMIRTGHLLADIAERLGYEVVGIDLFRTRLSTATKEQLREEVLILRWPGR